MGLRDSAGVSSRRSRWEVVQVGGAENQVLITNQTRSALRAACNAGCLHLMELGPEVAATCPRNSPVPPPLASLPLGAPSAGSGSVCPCEGGDRGEVQRPQETLEGMVAFLLT